MHVFFFHFFYRFRLIKTTYQRATTAVLITRFRDVRKITDFEPVRGEGSRAFWSTFCTPHFFGLNAAMHEPRRFPRTENTLLYMSLPREMPWFAFFCVFCVHRWQKNLARCVHNFQEIEKKLKNDNVAQQLFFQVVFFFSSSTSQQRKFLENIILLLFILRLNTFFLVFGHFFLLLVLVVCFAVVGRL